ncbi:MAG: sigma-54-dependent Fis family transcriptional regulator [Elusimicrobia bacterium]|nr:sigma-54-dependent Fis family transcriptional regulator [Elusimicrobiota bacterium]
MPERRPTVLIVDDEEKLRRFLRREFERKGYPVRAAGDRAAALAALADGQVDVVLLDIVMPGADGMALLEEVRREHPDAAVIMLTGNASVETAVRALKLGARDYLSKPYDMAELELAVMRAYAESCLRQENEALRLEHAVPADGPELTGASAAIAAVRRQLALLAGSDGPVLFEGEGGSGKERAARVLHALGPGPRAPFLVLDCALLGPSEAEARLFGQGPGKGLLELAARGTVFFDDIGKLPLPAQGRVLRLLENGEFRRDGEASPKRLRCRLTGAACEDLEAAVRQRRFSRDLLSRLSPRTVRVPPLRERPEDIPVLAERYLSSFAGSPGRTLAPEAAALLMRYPWPGNVRQLQSVLERARLKSEGPRIDAGHLFLPRTGDGPAEAPESLSAVERSHILKVLADCDGNRTRAAGVLGVDPKTLYNKLKEYRSRP